MRSRIIRGSPVPRYQQLADIMAAGIRDGRFGPGARFPSEHEWARRYGLSRHTVRQAVQQLEQQGFLSRQRGRGTFVRAMPLRAPAGGNGSAKDIGLLVPSVTISLYPEIVRSVEDVCADRGFHVILGNYDVIPEREKRYIDEMIARPVSGMIICPSYNSSAADHRRLIDRDIPFVLVDTDVEDAQADLVCTDNIAAAYEGTRRLIASGCRRVGFLSGYTTASTSRERLEGCRRAMQEHGLLLERALIAHGGYTAEFGEQAAERLLDAAPDLDGLFVANDPIASGALRALRASGRRVPYDVRVCTFDEPDLPLEERVPLLIVRQQRREIGTRAARLLFERIAEKQNAAERAPPRHVLVAANLETPLTLQNPSAHPVAIDRLRVETHQQTAGRDAS